MRGFDKRNLSHDDLNCLEGVYKQINSFKYDRKLLSLF